MSGSRIFLGCRTSRLTPQIRGAPAQQRTEYDDGHASPETGVKGGADPDRSEQTRQNGGKVGSHPEDGDIAFGDAITPGGVCTTHGSSANSNTETAMQGCL